MRNLFYLITVTCFLFIAQLVSAQSNYINHTLQQGESLSALAKQYNTNVGDIMRMNGMHADTKLVYGSVIKIPSNKKITAAPESVKPVASAIKPAAGSVTHKVVKGETLFSISKQYNVSVNDLKTWNNITGTGVQVGSILIAGNNTAATATEPVADIKRQRAVTTAQATAKPVTEPAQKTETVQTTEITQTIPDTSAGAIENNTSNNISEATTITNTGTAAESMAASSKETKNSAGYFADDFKKTKKEQHVSGVSKTFKTASGWSDGKYYILADDINPGTIVKLTADNGNAVYAKVLWNMGSLKENNGINFRISNATAAALNENADAFNLTVYY